jgi:hypothetical protein
MGYNIRNWANDHAALVHRGDITFWFSDDILSQWKHDNADQGQGRPFPFSDLAIETLLTIRELFPRPHRGTEGFGHWVFRVMQRDLAIPDDTSLCKRAKQRDIAIAIRKTKGAIHVIVDSTGLKVYGEGAWKIRTPGKSKRRTWRKLRLLIDADTQEIVAEVRTDHGVHDAEVVSPLRKQGATFLYPSRLRIPDNGTREFVFPEGKRACLPEISMG